MSDQQSQGQQSPGIILLVEDEPLVRLVAADLLSDAHFRVIEAADAEEALTVLKAGVLVDVVLSDVEMPGLDGFTLTRTIRRTKGWEHVPVVIMTSRGSEHDQKAGMDAGASAYLLKTEFDQDQLVETVRRLVGR